MKIRRSLKIFIVCTVMGMATLMVLGFAALTANYFAKGLDSGIRISMLEIGQYTDIQEVEPETVLGFMVAHSWEDVPLEVRNTFPKPTKHLEFLKKIERDNWISEPRRAFFLLRYDHASGDVLYISRVITDFEAAELSAQINEGKLPHFCQILSYAAIGLGLFAFFMYLLMQLVAKPIERLARWAKTLTPCQLHHPLPDFHFNELNRLAEVVKNSLSSVEDSLRREHKFLAHASHELRTPIAVVRSNTELMNKLIEKPNSIEKQKEVLERILRAGVTMTDLCETLLWLNRGEESELPTSEVVLGDLVKQLSQELNYLVRDKEVVVTIDVTQEVFLLPITLCRIVLSNLIRNAYQHTMSGTVTIEQTGNQVSIINYDHNVGDAQEQLGFGLGLELTHRIIRHYNWHFNIEEYQQGRDVFIEFSQ